MYQCINSVHVYLCIKQLNLKINFPLRYISTNYLNSVNFICHNCLPLHWIKLILQAKCYTAFWNQVGLSKKRLSQWNTVQAKGVIVQVYLFSDGLMKRLTKFSLNVSKVVTTTSRLFFESLDKHSAFSPPWYFL